MNMPNSISMDSAKRPAVTRDSKTIERMRSGVFSALVCSIWGQGDPVSEQMTFYTYPSDVIAPSAWGLPCFGRKGEVHTHMNNLGRVMGGSLLTLAFVFGISAA